MDFDLRAHTHLLVVAGSRAYGLHTEASDVDLRGLAIPPAATFYGIQHRFEQEDGAGIAIFADDLDPEERAAADRVGLEGTVYHLHKVARLASDCNPNILDILFCRDAEVRRITPLGERFREARHLFLSQRAREAYTGYANAQLQRIRRHRAWLLEPVEEEPTRAAYDLPDHTLLPRDQLRAAEAMVRRQVDAWEIDFGDLPAPSVTALQARIAEVIGSIDAAGRWQRAGRTIGLDENLLAVVERERRYAVARREYEQYQHWKRHRNPDRAALEARYGYDTKHAAHLVRLLRMGREVVTEGRVAVWREDAEELLAIRRGAWSYDALVEVAEAETAALRALRPAQMVVPARPDRERIDALVQELTIEALRAPSAGR